MDFPGLTSAPLPYLVLSINLIHCGNEYMSFEILFPFGLRTSAPLGGPAIIAHRALLDLQVR